MNRNTEIPEMQLEWLAGGSWPESELTLPTVLYAGVSKIT